MLHIMSVTLSELESFHHFAAEKLQSGGAESMEELFDLWLVEHPSAEEEADVHAAIREGLEDLKAGRYRPADEVMDELRAKYGF